MKLSLPVQIATLATLALSAFAPVKPVDATNFDEFAVDQTKFIAVAVPYNYKRYKLAIIEQVPGQRSCWRESGSNPTTVDLSLLNFDHTHACRKGVDTNGYSLRVNGQDDKVAYIINLLYNNGELQLVADHRDPNQPDLILGRTHGVRETPMKIVLEPEWQFTKRMYQGKAIQHIYVSNNPNPKVVENIVTLPTTNDPTVAPTTPPNSAQPLPQPTVAAQPIPPQTPSATLPDTLPGLISSILTPLTEAVYQTYNNLFASTTNTVPQYAPNTPNNSQP